MEPHAAHSEVIGAYRNFAMLLGQRTAELHLALSSSTDPSFEPHVYSAMDQRSKYQTARNLVGRVLAMMRRSIADLPRGNTRRAAEQVLEAEDAI